MKDLETFIEKARNNYESMDFIVDYNNNKLIKEVKGTYFYNQWLVINQLEHLTLEITKDFPEINIREKLYEAFKQEWPYEADDISKPWVEPSMMYGTEVWVNHLKPLKDTPHKLVAQLYATHSEIHKNQKSSILVDKLKTLFEKYYKDHKEEMLEEVKMSWDFKRGLVQDLMAHQEHMEEVLPRIALFKIGAKEIMEDKSGINNMSAGNRDETEDMKVRAELMKNAVTMREMDVDDLPEEYKDYVNEDIKAEQQKKDELDKKFKEAPKR
jgi:hypothetical protein